MTRTLPLLLLAAALLIAGVAVARDATSGLDLLAAGGLLCTGIGCLHAFVERDTRRPW